MTGGPDTTGPVGGAAEPAVTARRAAAIAAVVLVALAVVFLVRSWPAITAPFGHSDEGLNGAVWGYGSRSYRELGPVESALGGRRIDGTSYATHPPLLLTEAAALEAALGEHRWVTRAPAWLGSLAAIVLVYLLLRALRVGRVPAAAATVAALAAPLFFVYGWMLDTPVTAFPLGVAVALVWARDRDGRGPPGVVGFVLALSCGLAGWQASLFAALVGAWILVVEGRHEPARRRAAVPYLAGVVVGLALSFGWAMWVEGGLGPLVDKFRLRTAGEGRGLADALGNQTRWTAPLLATGLLGLGGALFALRDDRFRPLAAVGLVTVVGYSLVFASAASGHPYWNYWLLLPVAVGYGYLADRSWATLAGRGVGEGARTAILLGACVLLGVLNLARPSAARRNIDFGVEAVTALRATPPAPDQTELPYLGDVVQPEDWMRYELDVEGRQIVDEGALRALAADHPDHVVFVVGPCDPEDDLCERIWRGTPGTDDWQPLTAAEVVVRLDRGG